MNKDELIAKFEALKVSSPSRVGSKENLRNALLSSARFHHTGFWERIKNTMNVKKLTTVMAVALLAAVVLYGGYTYQEGTKRAEAKQVLSLAIEKLKDLPQNEKDALTHYLNMDSEQALREAYEANDLAIQDEGPSHPGGQPQKLVTWTNSRGDVVRLNILADGSLGSTGYGNPNMTLEQWLAQSNSQETDRYEAERLEQERIRREANPSLQPDTKYPVAAQGSTRTSDGTKNVPNGWTIYSNPLGYEVAYPTNWKLKDIPTDDSKGTSQVSFTPNWSSNPYSLLQVISTPYEGNMPDSLESGSERITINGIEMIKTILEPYENSSRIEYAFIYKGRLYTLLLERHEQQMVTNELANLVFATFKLTK